MARTLAHRGPDDEGVWTQGDAGIALGHRRLSILDLSREGHQPMASASGRFVLTFNGEVYNYVEPLVGPGIGRWATSTFHDCGRQRTGSRPTRRFRRTPMPSGARFSAETTLNRRGADATLNPRTSGGGT